MTKIPLVEPVAEPEELHKVFEQLRSSRGRVPGMYRALAHQPAILSAHRAYFHAALDSGSLPRALKEQIAFKVARMRESAYSASSHRAYAMRHGVSAEELKRVDESDYHALQREERVALMFAEQMVAGRGSVPPSTFEDLATCYSVRDIVELIALVGIMELACTLSAAFELNAD